MANVRGILNIQSLNELTYEKGPSRRARRAAGMAAGQRQRCCRSPQAA